LDAGERLLQRLMSVTPAQVQSVAQRLFDERQLNVGVLVPEGQQ
jgi:predicted Zn-dependent peptidase